MNILVAKSNSGSNTYDGIETGGERVTQEVEELLEELIKAGTPIAKLSIVGYSLGGLIARYAIGLLYSKGWFEKIKPINFTTFATPHLGVRTPLRGYHSQLWNAFGARTLSSSGRQLFTIDTFRDTNRPILSVLADPSSIFIRALSAFKVRNLYANIVNDRSVPYYTAAITSTDPFDDVDAVDLHTLKSYSQVILDPDVPVTPKSTKEPLQPFYTRFTTGGQSLLTRIPLYTALIALIPVATVAWTINSGIQSFRSNKRIQLHQQGKGLDGYRIPLLMNGTSARSAVSGAFRRVNSAHGHDYLPESQDDDSSDDVNSGAEEDLPKLELRRTSSRKADFPTLALSDEQFEMIRNLDRVGFRKYLVHIQNHRHTHAAIIVRIQKPGFDEGKLVVRHWLDEAFEL